VISGRTRWAALLGNPVAQALTPRLLNAELARQSVDGVMIAAQVTPGGLADVVRALRAMDNLCGAVVTMPCKRDVVPLLDEYTAGAAAVGACNIVHRGPGGRLTGHMTDGEAMSQAIETAGVPVNGRPAHRRGRAATAIALDLAARDGQHHRPGADPWAGRCAGGPGEPSHARGGQDRLGSPAA
jgi:shikimate dehydrogenase